MVDHTKFSTYEIISLYGILCGGGERNQGYALLMMANKPETALYRAPTFSLLLVSHVGISMCVYYVRLSGGGGVVVY